MVVCTVVHWKRDQVLQFPLPKTPPTSLFMLFLVPDEAVGIS
jgi:hypothetical protein